MFVGTNIHTLDGKGRIVMPASYRATINDAGGEVILTPGSDGNVAIFTVPRFQEIADEESRRPRVSSTRWDARKMFGDADHQRLDAQGRVLLKVNLREHADIADVSAVAVVGNNDRIEVWNQERLEAAQHDAELRYRPGEEEPGI